MGQIGYGLHGLFEGTFPKFIEQQRQQNGGAGKPNTMRSREMETVLRSTSKKLGVAKSCRKCFMPAQGLLRMPSFSRKIFERQRRAGTWRYT